jgi:DNA-binding response OmpR family regulator
MILVVEDDVETNRLITRLLAGEGFAVQSVTDAEAAYRRIKSEPVSLLVLDLQLPGLHGIELLVLLTAEGRRTPVIVVTGGEADEAVLRRFSIVKRRFAKPFRNEEFLRCVRDYVSAGPVSRSAPLHEA